MTRVRLSLASALSVRMLKSVRVKGHQRHLKSGKAVPVREHARPDGAPGAAPKAKLRVGMTLRHKRDGSLHRITDRGDRQSFHVDGLDAQGNPLGAGSNYSAEDIHEHWEPLT